MGMTSNKKTGSKPTAKSKPKTAKCKVKKRPTVATAAPRLEEEEIVESLPAVEESVESLTAVEESAESLPAIASQDQPFQALRIDWKSPYILSASDQKTAEQKIAELHRGVPGTEEQWDFDHLDARIKNLLAENPDSDLFLAGAPPQRFGDISEGNDCPSICVIKAPREHKPPPFAAVYMNESVQIVHLDDVKLSWEPVQGSQARHVYSLCRHRYSSRNNANTVVTQYEYATLHTIKPPDRMVDGRLDIDIATFVYAAPDGDIEETYEKDGSLQTFCELFCDGHGLDPDDHVAGVKNAIKAGFASAREEQESMLSKYEAAGYDEDLLNGIEVVAKVFPRNTAITDLDKSNYINRFYLKAKTVV
jgi:hypothetical protein